jgi:hypothetical protein
MNNPKILPTVRFNRWAHLVVTACIIVARRPAALFHPQFWAEDGSFWYHDAYTLGARSLLYPAAGYLQTLARLTAWLAAQFPLSAGPGIYAVVALAFQILPVVILLSPRLDQDLVSWRGRLAMVYFYALVPNSFEWNMNVTNAQWHLALAAFMLIVSSSAAGRVNLLESGVVGLSGLSGPFAIFFLPFALWEHICRRTRRSCVFTWVVTLTAVTQLFFIMTMVSVRSQTHLGASAVALCKIIAYQILLAGVLGSRLTGLLLTSTFWRSDAAAVCLVVFAGLLALASMASGPVIYRKGFIFVGLLFAAALITPNVHVNKTGWDEMLFSGDRYYIAPILIWFATIVILRGSKRIGFRLISSALVALAFLGICFDFAYPPYVPTNFSALAAAFSAAKPCEVMVFPENPPGWSMVLRKHGSGWSACRAASDGGRFDGSEVFPDFQPKSGPATTP